MRKNSSLLTLAVAIFLLLTPVLGADLFARHSASVATRDQAMLLARDALHRSEVTTQQAATALDLLNRLPAGGCSPRTRSLMRDLDVSSSYLQAIGHTRGNILVCSSLNDPAELDLGPVDYVSPSGTTVRLNVRLPFAPHARFVVAGRDGFVAIIHTALPIDVTTDSSVGLATVAVPGHQLIAARGDLDPQWLGEVSNGPGDTFISHGRPVATIASKDFFIGTVAALSTHALDRQLARTRRYMLPAGVLIGVLLCAGGLLLDRRRLSMPVELRAGLRRHEFFLLYQPVVDLMSGQVVGAEALMRWRRPDGRLVPPDIFIKVAEDADAIKLVTQRVVELLRQDARGLFQAHPELYLALNLSADDVMDTHTSTMLAELSSDLEAPAGGLVAEITERGFVDAVAARPVLEALHRAQVRIAIDDFGTGYSSLASLQELNLDLLKIDKAFVQSLGAAAATSNVVFHIVEIARTLGLRLVAEGIETVEQADALRALGVTFAQGWLFGRPMPLDEVLALIPADPGLEGGVPSQTV